MTRRLLVFREAMAYLGLEGTKGEQHLRRLVEARKVPVYRDGRLFFMSDELDEWLRQRRTPAIDEPKSKHLALPPAVAKPTGIDDLKPRRSRLQPWLHEDTQAS